MELSKPVYLAIIAGMGLCWTITYILIINRSFKGKTCGMPFIALAFNMSWEFVYSFVFAPLHFTFQRIINITWFLFDVFIFVAYLLFAQKEWKTSVYRIWFWPNLIFTLVASYLMLYYFHLDFGKGGITYSGYLDNVIMSGLFISMFLKRNSLNGQSLGIAFFKMMGTLCATIILFNGFNQFLCILGIICFVLDLVYLVLLLNFYKANKLNYITRQSLVIV
jgi:hypothetical protein